jgi:hypothetical protein
MRSTLSIKNEKKIKENGINIGYFLSLNTGGLKRD